MKAPTKRLAASTTTSNSAAAAAANAIKMTKTISFPHQTHTKKPSERKNLVPSLARVSLFGCASSNIALFTTASIKMSSVFKVPSYALAEATPAAAAAALIFAHLL